MRHSSVSSPTVENSPPRAQRPQSSTPEKSCSKSSQHPYSTRVVQAGDHENEPSNRCFPQVSSNSLRRSHVSHAKRRDSTCKTRRCTLQAFLLFVEWLELVIWALRSAACRGRRRDWLRLAQSLRGKDQSFLAPSQRSIENAMFLLIVRLGSII